MKPTFASAAWNSIVTRIWLILLFVGSIFAECNLPQSKKNEAGGNPPSTSIHNEKAACLLSQIAYCGDPGRSLAKYAPGWNLVWDGKELDGNKAIVVFDGTSYAVAIRGSVMDFSWAAVQNWIYQDLNVVSVEKWPYTDDGSSARVGLGSFQGFRNLGKMIDEKTGQTLFAFLDKKTITETPVLITGHSLGGNLATLYASWIWQEFKNAGHPHNNINVITFAAPAAGSAGFADDFDKKFPDALRFENKYDIVPKFPSSRSISSLGNLFDSSLSAANINVGYKNISMSLDKVFGSLSTALSILELTNGISDFKQPCGNGKQVTGKLSAKNSGGDIGSWLQEAGYQHGIARYAEILDVPLVDCR